MFATQLNVHLTGVLQVLLSSFASEAKGTVNEAQLGFESMTNSEYMS